MPNRKQAQLSMTMMEVRPQDPRISVMRKREMTVAIHPMGVPKVCYNQPNVAAADTLNQSYVDAGSSGISNVGVSAHKDYDNGVCENGGGEGDGQNGKTCFYFNAHYIHGSMLTSLCGSLP
jgi:hypothetical protein